MPVKHDRDSDLTRARAFLNTFSSNSADAEALTAFHEYRKTIKRHGFSLADLLTGSDGKPMGLQDLMSAMQKGGELVDKLKAAVVDPDVQSGVKSLVDLFKAGQEISKKVRGR